jgi:ABC-type dipeptide/oligopeptide/nickel transport system ATPase component
MTLQEEMPTKRANLLAVNGLSGGFPSRDGFARILDDVSFGLETGTITAIVGETGSGKSMTALSIMGLLPKGFVRTGGQILFEHLDLGALRHDQLRRTRGAEVAMVFQDARAALNPVFTVGRQISDVYRAHRDVSRKKAWEAAVTMLDRVRIPEPERRMKQYPHEFSGGMAQRVVLAMALVSQPRLLLLDEPTTGLDVTIQADIMELIVELTRSTGLTTCLITHDLGLVAQYCGHVVVMRDGRVRETGTCEEIFTAPKDSYTVQLIEASRMVEHA